MLAFAWKNKWWVLAILWIVTLWAHGWLFWLLLSITLLVTLYFVAYVINRNISPWRRIYFPLIDRYAFLGGAHVGFADMTNTLFSPLKLLLVLLKEYAPNWPDSEIQSSLEQWKRELDAFDCREFFAQVFRDVNNSKDQSRLDEMVEKAREHMMDENNYNGALVRYVIGQVIEREAGLEQKKRYWKAVLSGKVA